MNAPSPSAAVAAQHATTSAVGRTDAEIVIVAPPALEREEAFYANGKLMSHGTIKRMPDGPSVKQGIWSNYWASGELCTFGAYEDGEKVGDWPFFMESGGTCITNRYRPATRASPGKAPQPPSATSIPRARATPVPPPASSPEISGALVSTNQMSPEEKIRVGQQMMDRARVRIEEEQRVLDSPQTPPNCVKMGDRPPGMVPLGSSPSGMKKMDTTPQSYENFRRPSSKVIRTWSNSTNALEEARRLMIEGSNLVESARQEVGASPPPSNAGGGKP